MKPFMIFIRRFLHVAGILAFDLFALGTACVLLLKAHWANDIHCTLREDPMEQWIAIAIAVLILERLRTKFQIKTRLKGNPNN